MIEILKIGAAGYLDAFICAEDVLCSVIVAVQLLHCNCCIANVALQLLQSICETLEISLGVRHQEISPFSRNIWGVCDGFPNTSLVLVEHVASNAYNSANEMFAQAAMNNSKFGRLHIIAYSRGEESR